MVSLLILFTGNGDYFCSGNDLSNFTDVHSGEVEEKGKRGAILLR